MAGKPFSKDDCVSGKEKAELNMWDEKTWQPCVEGRQWQSKIFALQICKNSLIEGLCKYASRRNERFKSFLKFSLGPVTKKTIMNQIAGAPKKGTSQFGS